MKNSNPIAEAFTELESFSETVSNDLRVSLRSITGYSIILKEESWKFLNPEGKKALSIIIKNADRMNRLIDEMLAFSKGSKVEMNRTHVHVDNLVHTLVREISEMEKKRKFKINIGDLPDCYADPALLKQVWTHLISNAIKYSGKREITKIDIGFNHGKKGITYFIKDNGVGFDMKYYHKLFNVFQRLHPVHEFEGSGIGLALVRKIIERHGGKIWAESEPDQGAVFYFTVPVKGHRTKMDRKSS